MCNMMGECRKTKWSDQTVTLRVDAWCHDHWQIKEPDNSFWRLILVHKKKEERKRECARVCLCVCVCVVISCVHTQCVWLLLHVFKFLTLIITTVCVGLTLTSVLLINIYIICSERRKLMFEKKRTSYPAADQYEKSLVAKPTKQKHFEAKKKEKKWSDQSKVFFAQRCQAFFRQWPSNSSSTKLNVL